MEKNNAYVEVLAKIASLMGRTKESIQMSSSNTHTSITMFAENNSKIIGNWYFDSSDSKELIILILLLILKKTFFIARYVML